jgi:hypothetical protein
MQLRSAIDADRLDNALRAADFTMTTLYNAVFPLDLPDAVWPYYAAIVIAHYEAQEPSPMQAPSPDNLLRDVTPFLNDLALATRELSESVRNVPHPEDSDTWIQPDWISPLPDPKEVVLHLGEIEIALRGIAATWGIPIDIDTEEDPDEEEDPA